MIPYVKAQNCGFLPIKGTTLTLTALSTKGTIMMPIVKSEKDLIKNRKVSMNRSELLNAARRGDEEAIESLTLDDMDTYTAISKKSKRRCIQYCRYLLYALRCGMRPVFHPG